MLIHPLIVRSAAFCSPLVKVLDIPKHAGLKA